MSNFLQHCVNLSTRRWLNDVATFAFSPLSTKEYVERLQWLDKRFKDEFLNARIELSSGMPDTAPYRNYRRRTDAAIDSATELWGQVNGSVDAIPRIMEQVSRENHLLDCEVTLVERFVFGKR